MLPLATPSGAFLTLLDMPPPTASPAPQQGRRRGRQEAHSQWSSSRTPFASVSARKKRKKPPSAALQTASASVTVVDDESASAPPPSADNVKVLVRIRPMNEAERGLRQMRTLSLFTADRERTQQDTLFYRVPGEGSAAMTNHDSHGHTFTFDHVLDEKAGQEQVFARVGCPVVQTCLQGINTTVFAYGQTGSGKTHTMHGDMQGGEHAGLTPRILQHLFEQAGSRREGTRVSVRANPCLTSRFAWRAPVTAVGASARVSDALLLRRVVQRVLPGLAERGRRRLELQAPARLERDAQPRRLPPDAGRGRGARGTRTALARGWQAWGLHRGAV
eukprot:COSAG01_NODE_155_length_23814_cov_12.061343_18_plen_332_part_00